MSPRQAHRGPYSGAARRIGSRLAEIRADYGLTQADLAARLGITERTYRSIEHSDFVSDTNAFAIAAALGMDGETLLQELEHGSVEGSHGGAAA